MRQRSTDHERLSAACVGAGLRRGFLNLYLTSPLGHFLLEHPDQTSRLVKFGAHALEICFETLEFPRGGEFFFLHALLDERDVFKLLRFERRVSEKVGDKAHIYKTN
jgi:hypothetical protein